MTDNQKIKALKALGDQARLDLFRTIRDKKGECMGGEAASACMQLAQPTISHHMRTLVDAGLLNETKKGLNKSYCINYNLFEELGLDISKV
jgi:ArsR family transcriptional regulator, arsenate/arsenite/antimonite-responsive transcriptional repressor